MEVLHLVSRSPGESQAFSQCLGRLGAGDAVLLLEGGVYAALKGSVAASDLREVLAGVGVYALEPDLAARGIGKDELLEGVVRVDYAGFVELTLVHTPILSWT